MEYTAKQIVELLGGGIIVGDEETKVSNINRIETAGEGDLTFFANEKYEPYVYSTEASIILASEGFQPKAEIKATLVKVTDPYSSMAKLMQAVQQNLLPTPKGIDALAEVHGSAQIGDDCYVGAFAYIAEDVRIGKGCKIYPYSYIGRGSIVGDNTVIYPHVTIYHGCTIGRECILHAGSVIGADGFGFAPQLDGYHKIPQIGDVILGDRVEVGANTCIDRAALGSTIIEEGTKLDNLVQIAHNCSVGKHTVVAAQAGMAGSSHLGSWCQVGGQVGIAGHLKVGDRVGLAGQTGVLGNVADGENLFGSPAMEAGTAKRSFVVMPKLPEMYKKIGQLERELTALKAQINNN